MSSDPIQTRTIDDLLKFPVLTNSTYSQSLLTQQKISEVKGENQPIMRDNSLRRFSDACTMIRDFKPGQQNALDYAFSILNKVSQGGFTKWSIVYDISSRQIHFITSENRDRYSLSFSDFIMDCSFPSMALAMDRNEKGSDSKTFKELSFEANKKLVETSIKESSSIIQVADEEVQATINFYNKVFCPLLR